MIIRAAGYNIESYVRAEGAEIAEAFGVIRLPQSANIIFAAFATSRPSREPATHWARRCSVVSREAREGTKEWREEGS
jgi:hypothetical protein